MKCLTFLIVFSCVSLHAQTQFEATIKGFDAEEVIGYVQPLANLFGANMNAGFNHSAALPENGFHIHIELLGMVSLVREEDREYDAILPEGFVPQGGSRKTATVFGGKGTTFRDANSGLEYKGTDGMLSTQLFPLLVPQASIGTLFGTEAVLRYISTPTLSGGKLPSSTLWGIGLRHNISQYFGEIPPFDMCVGFLYTSFSVGEIMEFTGMAMSLQISKSFSLLTLYGGFASESSSMSLRYTSNAPSSPKLVDVNLNGANVFRTTMGLLLDLQAIRLYADANLGFVRHFSGGIGFGF
jgi:hypothetical protein